MGITFLGQTADGAPTDIDVSATNPLPVTGGGGGGGGGGGIVDGTGRTIIVGAAADNATASGAPVLVGGMDGTGKVQTILVAPDGSVNVNTGVVVVGGAVANGVAVSGNPLRVAGRDTGNLTRDILTEADGTVHVLSTSVAGIAQATAVGTTADAAVTDGSLNTAGSTLLALTKGLLSTLRGAYDSALGALVVRLKSDVVTGALYHLDVTLSATPETLTTITIPDTVRGFKMYSTVGSFRFALSESPATPRAASSSTTIAAAAFGVGGTVWTNIPETRLLPPGVGRTLQLRSGTASNLVSIELF